MCPKIIGTPRSWLGGRCSGVESQEAVEHLRGLVGRSSKRTLGDVRGAGLGADAVDAVERDVLSPAVRIMFDAFAPDPNTRLQMTGSNLALGWQQMEQTLAYTARRES